MAQNAGIHEAMDRTYILMETFSEYVQNHPEIVKDEELSILTERASQALMDVYQSCGAKESGPGYYSNALKKLREELGVPIRGKDYNG